MLQYYTALCTHPLTAKASILEIGAHAGVSARVLLFRKANIGGEAYYFCTEQANQQNQPEQIPANIISRQIRKFHERGAEEIILNNGKKALGIKSSNPNCQFTPYDAPELAIEPEVAPAPDKNEHDQLKREVDRLGDVVLELQIQLEQLQAPQRALESDAVQQENETLRHQLEQTRGALSKALNDLQGAQHYIAYLNALVQHYHAYSQSLLQGMAEQQRNVAAVPNGFMSNGIANGDLPTPACDASSLPMMHPHVVTRGPQPSLGGTPYNLFAPPQTSSTASFLGVPSFVDSNTAGGLKLQASSVPPAKRPCFGRSPDQN